MKEYSGKLTGVVENPLLEGKIDWELVKTKELPRKCDRKSGGCGLVYPSDHVDAPKLQKMLCQPCMRRSDETKNQEK